MTPDTIGPLERALSAAGPAGALLVGLVLLGAWLWIGARAVEQLRRANRALDATAWADAEGEALEPDPPDDLPLRGRPPALTLADHDRLDGEMRRFAADLAARRAATDPQARPCGQLGAARDRHPTGQARPVHGRVVSLEAARLRREIDALIGAIDGALAAAEGRK